MIVKLVYFDEEAAVDYINIIDGGQKNEKEISGKDTSDLSTARIKTGLMAKVGTLLPFMETKVEASATSDIEITNNAKKIIESTITNTVLTDYLDKISRDEKVSKFENFKLRAVKDSLANFKMYTPYIETLNGDKMQEIDLTKLDYVLENAKGYYEFIGINGNKKHIFRINIKALRNNYKLADLIKMNLTYYGVKVGKWKESDLNVYNELDFQHINEISSESETELDVYDIILSGVECNE